MTGTVCRGVCLLLGIAVLLAHSLPDGFKLYLLDPSTGALCLDGTPGGFYVRFSPNNSNPNWLIHFEGGAWCVDEQDCLERSLTERGSSANWSLEGVPDMGGRSGGFLSSNPRVNPFYDWNMVHINYCDGASFSGYRAEPVTVLSKEVYFRGASILVETFNVLFDWGLNDAKTLIVGGSSAGGLAVFLHIDYIRSIVPKSVRVVGFPDAAMFMNVSAYKTSFSFASHYKYIFNMQNISEWTMDGDCIQINSDHPERCFFSEHVLPHINTPLFLSQSLVDRWSLEFILQIPCYQDRRLSNCSTLESRAVVQFSKQMLNSLDNALNRKDQIHGAFLHSCIHHSAQRRDDLFSGKKIKGQTMAQTFHSWLYNGKASKRVVDDLWPKGCN